MRVCVCVCRVEWGGIPMTLRAAVTRPMTSHPYRARAVHVRFPPEQAPRGAAGGEGTHDFVCGSCITMNLASVQSRGAVRQVFAGPGSQTVTESEEPWRVRCVCFCRSFFSVVTVVACVASASLCFVFFLFVFFSCGCCSFISFLTLSVPFFGPSFLDLIFICF